MTELDSQVVVNRYMQALASLERPKATVFTYSVSQAGFHNLEETHRIFRSGTKQRDETLVVNGDPLKSVRMINGRIDRYAVERIAPRLGSYAFLFLGTLRDGKHLDYVYSTAPLGAPGFVVKEVTIDGLTYLPSLVRFSMRTGKSTATGAIAYAKFAKYWMPTLATVGATINKRSTRERIAFSGYAFPGSLAASTFSLPKKLASPTPP
ncbi:MAG: hypothetical protein ABR584_03460 [Candidatus Baltobacteraceae bacterium]